MYKASTPTLKLFTNSDCARTTDLRYQARLAEREKSPYLYRFFALLSPIDPSSITHFIDLLVQHGPELLKFILTEENAEFHDTENVPLVVIWFQQGVD